MMRILFVCHGNICRSPMAEFVLKDMVRKRGISDRFQIASAATSREEAQHGIRCQGHQARQMTKEDYSHYDRVICMDHANLRNISRLSGGDPEGKLSLLLDYTPRAGQEVADPWYTGNFDDTWRDVTEGCEGLLAALEEEQ